MGLIRGGREVGGGVNWGEGGRVVGAEWCWLKVFWGGRWGWD